MTTREKVRLKTVKKIIIGALGGLSPLLVNCLIVDLELQKITIWILIGWFIKGIVIAFIGGIVAFLHNENNPIRVFELGIIAPTLILSLSNGNIAVNNRNDFNAIRKEMHGSNVLGVSSSFSIFVSKVYAQTTDNVKKFSRDDSAAGEIWRGITGKPPQNIWFVIVGSHLKLGDAQKQAEYINQGGKGFHAEIYEPYVYKNPYRATQYYAVVIGENLTLGEAQKLKNQAIEAGFPKDIFLWALPPE